MLIAEKTIWLRISDIPEAIVVESNGDEVRFVPELYGGIKDCRCTECGYSVQLDWEWCPVCGTKFFWNEMNGSRAWNLYAWEYPYSDYIMAVPHLSYRRATDISNRLMNANPNVDVYISPEVPSLEESFEHCTVTLVAEEKLFNQFGLEAEANED